MARAGSDGRVLLATAGSHLTVSPPLGLLTLAAVLRRAGARVEIHDLAVHPERIARFLERCRAEDVLWAGFSSSTPSLPATREVALAVRRLREDLPLVLGGVHATALPRETLLAGPWDAVCVGEGEGAVAEITRRVARGEGLAGIPGILWRREPDSPVEPGVVADLGSLPLPAWDLVDLREYQRAPWQLVRRGRRIAPLMTSRGCPYRCIFCAGHVVAGARTRLRPLQMVLDEAEMLARQYGVDELHILDDAMNARLEHAKHVAAGLLERELRLAWKTPNGLRVDRWDRELLELIRRSGGYQVGFGIESADPRVLRASEKPLDLDAAHGTISAFERAGISTFGFFIVGLPGESLDSARRTRAWASRSALTHAHASLAVPYPGTPLYRRLAAAGRIGTDWNAFRHTRPFPTCEIEPDTLRAQLRAFYARFYASPRRAARLGLEAMRTGPRAFARTAWSYMVRANAS